MTAPHAPHTTRVADRYPDFLRDESRLAGAAESISFPTDETELQATLADLYARDVPITIQAARTGITGGAVPRGGHVLNLSRMNRMLGLRRDDRANTFHLLLQPGVLLQDIRDALRSCRFDTEGWSDASLKALDTLRQSTPHFFAPDPTEMTAAIGGAVACNASGARTYRYGPTREHVSAMRVLLASGEPLDLARGAPCASGRRFEVTTPDGRCIWGDLPTYAMPHVKNAAGYYAADCMDIMDLFIGSEGTLGVFSTVELRLLPRPAAMWGVTVFLPGEEEAVAFVRAVRSRPEKPAAIELLDSHALGLLRRLKQESPTHGELPDIPEAWHTGVYVEYHADNEDAAEEAVAALGENLERCGGDMDATWLADGEREIDRFKAVRHAVPEAVNRLIDERRKAVPALTKLGTDLAVPDDALEEVLAMYRHDLAAAHLQSAIFGHIGNNHVHVNIIPRDMDEYARGKALYMNWAERVAALGGTVSAEHGIGKLKTAFLEMMYGPASIEEMRKVKRVFDPKWLLNQGNLFTRA